MCQAFSGLFLKDGSVAWKFAVDSHEDLIRDNGLADDGQKQDFVRIEIVPKNGSYLRPDEWIFKVDQKETPDWFRVEFAEVECRKAHAEWLKKLRKILPEQDLIHPFRDIKPPKKITEKHLILLKRWASVWDSVWASVWDSVRDSVWDSVWASVWASVRDSVRDSVGDSVWASVWAYIGSLFVLPRSAWKYTDKIKTKGYPFQPAVDLWKMGLVSSFDGKAWRLHGGEGGKVLWEGKLTEGVNK